jgi:hypothetical protein
MATGSNLVERAGPGSTFDGPDGVAIYASTARGLRADECQPQDDDELTEVKREDELGDGVDPRRNCDRGHTEDDIRNAGQDETAWVGSSA